MTTIVPHMTTITPYTSAAEVTTPHTCTAGITASHTTCHIIYCYISCSNSTEQDALYATLNQAKVKPVILKLVSPYSNSFIPVQSWLLFPS